MKANKTQASNEDDDSISGNKIDNRIANLLNGTNVKKSFETSFFNP